MSPPQIDPSIPDLILGLKGSPSTHLQSRKGRPIALDLGPELGAECLFQRRNDATSELCGVFVGERPLR